jgi:hypothetical protein
MQFLNLRKNRIWANSYLSNFQKNQILTFCSFFQIRKSSNLKNYSKIMEKSSRKRYLLGLASKEACRYLPFNGPGIHRHSLNFWEKGGRRNILSGQTWSCPGHVKLVWALPVSCSTTPDGGGGRPLCDPASPCAGRRAAPIREVVQVWGHVGISPGVQAYVGSGMEVQYMHYHAYSRGELKGLSRSLAAWGRDTFGSVHRELKNLRQQLTDLRAVPDRVVVQITKSSKLLIV